jgi:uncharacterized protein (UPF0371 family)
VERFDNKLYLEFGGKLVFDYHAARVLPGCDPNVKMRLLASLADRSDVTLCIYAGDIERRRIRGDFGITYDSVALKTIEDLGGWRIEVRAVVITHFDGQESAQEVQEPPGAARRAGVHPPLHQEIPHGRGHHRERRGLRGQRILRNGRADRGGIRARPNSGKLATCLSQLCHEHKRGVEAGYAKLETFPIWNLSLAHPVNVAYEAATADIGVFNAIDSFHLEATNERTVNYNRELEVFAVLKRIMVTAAAAAATGAAGRDDRHGQELPADARGLQPDPERGRAPGGHPGQHPPAVPADHDHLEPLQEGHPGQPCGEPGPGGDPDRTVDQRAMNPTAQAAVEKLAELQGCEAHINHIPTPGDEAGLRKLGLNLTCDPNFASKDLFVG